MAVASLLNILLKDPKVWRQVVQALPLIKDSAELLYQGAKLVVNDFRERRGRNATERSTTEPKSEVDVLRSELAAELERIEARVLEQAELATKVADQLTLLAALIRVNQFRSLLGLWLAAAALVVSVIAVVIAVSK